MIDSIEVIALAKINLTLDVLSKRQDGYHELKMIMQTISLHDKIDIKKSVKGIKLKSNLSYLPINRKNIVYQTAECFFEYLGSKPEVEIDIKKNIPVAAGLAGGSTNSAAVLKGLNEMYGYPIPFDELLKIGGKLGADVPYCMIGGTMLAEGIGDILTSLSAMQKTTLVLAKPPVSVSTAWVYGNLSLNKIVERPDTEGVIKALSEQCLKNISVRLFNVLENVSAKRYPIINTIKSSLIHDGALGSVMSGSGPSVYGLFEDGEKAKVATKNLKKICKEVFILHTM